jgi:phosphatidylglycerophosphate synthase
MVLYDLRNVTDKLLEPIILIGKNVNPNFITFISLLLAIIAGYFFYLGYLILASIFVLLNSLLDILDGSIARRYKKTTIRGDFIDNVLDRYSDIFIMIGIVLSVYNRSLLIGFLAIIGVILTSYVACQSKSSCGKNIEKGLLGRPERNLLFILIPVIQYVMIISGNGKIYNIWLMEWMLIYILISGHFTAIYRVLIGWKLCKLQDLKD